MAIIPQQRIFGWEEIENLEDLDRLRLVLEYIPDEKLMRELEIERGNGRNEYPVRAMWNSILAGIVYQHESIASLRRELARNGQLRFMCGFGKGVPLDSAYTRFINKLMNKEDKVNAIFDNLVKQLSEELPGFGKTLAIDGNGIDTHANPTGKNKEPDGRRDVDANHGVKTYKGKREDGTMWEKIVSWFGYKLHLIVDAEYELPVAFEVTKASAAESPQAHKLVDELNDKHPELLQECEHFLGDRGYDDGKLIRKLYDEHGIKPVIDIRNSWKDGEETKLIEGFDNVVYNYRGQVFCHCMVTGKNHEMAYAGYEKDRETLKYRTPCHQYGIECKGAALCPLKSNSIRIKLEEDRRVFTPLARSSYKWKETYKKRTAVERVNSRFDVSFGFNNHYIKGKKKMKLRCSLALIVMLAMALGRVKEKQEDKLRSLVA